MTRISFRQGIVRHQTDALGNPTFLQKSGNYVNLNVSPDFTVIAFIHGDTDYLYTEHVSINNAWGPFTLPQDYWLYWDLNTLTGVVTRNHTSLEPIISPTTPGTPAIGQMWFNPTTKKWYEFSGATFVEVIRVFAAKLASGATLESMSINAPSDFKGTQVGLTTPTRIGSLIYATDSKPLKLNGKFFTTETSFLTGVPTSASLRISNCILEAKANTPIAAYQVVQYEDFNTIGIANPSQQGKRTFGILEQNASTNQTVSFTVEGIIYNENWDWEADNATVNDAVYVSNTGEITTTQQFDGQLPIGLILGKQEIIFSPKLFPQIKVGTEELTHGVTVVGKTTTVNNGSLLVLNQVTGNGFERVLTVSDIDASDHIDGPNSSTDNGLLRWDGTSGQLAQDSSATLDDNGLLTVDTLNATTAVQENGISLETKYAQLNVQNIFTQNQTIQKSDPALLINNTSLPVDEKQWALLSLDSTGTGNLGIYPITDGDVVNTATGIVLLRNADVLDQAQFNINSSIDLTTQTITIDASNLNIVDNLSNVILYDTASNELKFHHNNELVLQTTPGSSGGILVKNTLTGVGLERVLTTSDGNTYQPLDSDLTAIANLITDSYGRGLLELSTATDIKEYINIQEELSKVTSLHYPGQYLSNVVYTGDFLEIEDAHGVNGLCVRYNNDGTKLFVLASNTGILHEFVLGVAHDINTISYTGNTFSAAAQDPFPYSFEFSTNGTKLFVAGFTSQAVHEYDLSTGYDLSTVSFTGNSFDVSPQEGTITALTFDNTGNNMYIAGQDNKTIYQYSLSVPYSLTAVTYTGKSKNITETNDNNPRDIVFNSNGTKLIYIGSAFSRLFEFNLTTAYDISTALYSGSFYSTQAVSKTDSIALANDNTFVVLADNSGFPSSKHLYEYTFTALGFIRTAYTVDPTLGGLYVNNTQTGAGAERVLTESDLAKLEFYPSALDYILDNTLSPPTENSGDRYILSHDGGAPHVNWDGATAGDIVEYDGVVWNALSPTVGSFISVDDDATGLYYWGGASWEFKLFENTTASTGLIKVGADIQLDPTSANVFTADQTISKSNAALFLNNPSYPIDNRSWAIASLDGVGSGNLFITTASDAGVIQSSTGIVLLRSGLGLDQVAISAPSGVSIVGGGLSVEGNIGSTTGDLNILSGNANISGVVTGESGIVAGEDTDPTLKLIQTQSVDNKIWDIGVHGASVFELRTLTDDELTTNTFLSATRAGLDITNLTLSAQAIDIDAADIVLKSGSDNFIVCDNTSGIVQLYKSGTLIFDSQDPSAGGGRLNNTLTGAGLERILTESDLTAGITRKPLLDLFNPNKLVDVMSGSLTVDRPYTIYYKDKYNILQTIGSDQVPQVNEGWLFQAINVGKNKLLYSEDFSNVVWTTTRSTITSNNTIAPDATNTIADTITEDGTVGNTHLTSQDVTVVGTGHHIFSIFVKRNTGTRNIQLRFDSTAFGVNAFANFDLSNGTVNALGADAIDAGVDQYTNGWYRIYVRSSATATGLSNIQCRMLDGSFSDTYDGDSSSSLDLFGAQVDEFVDSLPLYAKTEDTVTPNRSSTSITFDTLYNFPLLEDPFTIVIEFKLNEFTFLQDGSGNTKTIFELYNNESPFPSSGRGLIYDEQGLYPVDGYVYFDGFGSEFVGLPDPINPIIKIAIIGNGISINIYVDGTLAGTVNYDSSGIPGPILFGDDVTYRDLRVYDYALSPNAIF